jgi:hypothetical protein
MGKQLVTKVAVPVSSVQFENQISAADEDS